jgi:hypothetical protein
LISPPELLWKIDVREEEEEEEEELRFICY